MKFAPLLILAFLSCILPAMAQSGSGGRTILILDASGSMWGQIDGTAKIEIARTTAEDLIKNRPKDLQMGLMAYGHRRKGDCDDIELIVPPGTETTEKLLAALDQLVPKGKTPIFKSVLQAADALKYTEEAGSVILVSDGIETCGGDLAALGKLLAEKGIDFKTHIVGFAMADEDTVALRGLAKATGGLYADAGDAESLKIALQTAVVAASKPVTSLTLIPLDQDGTSILKNGVGFTISKSKTDETALFQGSGGQWSTELDPGTYHATATFGGRTLEAGVTAEAGRNSTHTFTFSAPVLSLAATLQEGGEPLTEGVAWDIYGEPNAEGKRAKVTYSYHAQPKLRLAPGKYLVTARRGSARLEQEITFTEEPQSLTLVFGAGNLTMTASLTEDGDALTDGLAWDVYGEPNSEGNRTKFAYSYDAKPKFTLPAGTYLVSARKGNASASVNVDIVAGKENTGRVVLASGFLASKVILSAGQEPRTGDGVAWDVWTMPDAEGKRAKASYSYHAQPKFTLPAGEYLVTVKIGNATASQEVTVNPGKQTDVTINLNATIYKPVVVMQEGADAITGDGIAWDIHTMPDAEGKTSKIAYSYNAQPYFTLPVGEYTTSVKRGNSTASMKVKLVAGQPNTATLNLNATILKTAIIMKEGGGKYAGDGVAWDVWTAPNAEGKRSKISYSYSSQPTFILPVGTYRLDVKRGNATGSREVEIAGGKLNEASINLNAGLLKVTPVDEAGKPITNNTAWDIYGPPNAEGKRPKIAYSYGKVPTWVLPAGPCQIAFRSGDLKATADATVTAGQLTDLTLTIKK